MQRFVKSLLIISFLSFGFFNVFAGGPMLVDDITNSGEPSRWPFNATKGKWVVEVWGDPGQDAIIRRLVVPLLDSWKNVKLNLPDGSTIVTVALDIQYKGKLSDLEAYKDIGDITVSNYTLFTNVAEQDQTVTPPTVIIFDADGSITENYFAGQESEKCPKPKNCIAGFAAPSRLDRAHKVIQAGVAVLNGRLINGISNSDDGELASSTAEAEKRFLGIILHEIGHMLNLDHSQVNLEIADACSLSGSCEQGDQVVTMYPELKSTEQFILHRDDKVAISFLYPNQAFKDNFCTIVGEIQNEEGKGMQGVNVIARNVNEPFIDARSMVSGVMFGYDTANGTYHLAGILPNKEYEVFYEELNQAYVVELASTFSPLGVDSPKDFGSDIIPGPDGKQTVHCSSGGGQTISMPAIRIVSSELPQSPGESADEGASSQKKGWCSLQPNASQQVDFGSFFSYILIYAALLPLVVCRFFGLPFGKRSKYPF